MASATEIEKKYVIDIYNEIAPHFDKTRTGNWKEAKDFIMNIKAGSHVADIGCGSGGKMLLREDCTFVGVDNSNTMVEICKKKGLTCTVGNILQLELSSNTFDCVLCIAVIHHLSTEENRKQAILELIRIAKTDALIYIQVWGFESFEKSKKIGGAGSNKVTNVENMTDQDKYIGWKLDSRFSDKPDIYQRYYHFFKNGELEQLIPLDQVSIVRSFYDHNNYGIIIKKT